MPVAAVPAGRRVLRYADTSPHVPRCQITTVLHVHPLHMLRLPTAQMQPLPPYVLELATIDDGALVSSPRPAGLLTGRRYPHPERRRRGSGPVAVAGVAPRLPRPLRPPPEHLVDRDGGYVLAHVPAQGRRRLPRQGVLQLLLLRQRGGVVPGVRQRRPPRRRRHAQARGRRLPGADLPRDHRRVGDGARRALLLGPLLQGRDQRVQQLLRRQQHGVALRPRQVLPRPRTHATLMELQLRAGGGSAVLRRAGQPGGGGERPGGGVQGGLVVLDDAAGAQAVVPRRDAGAVRAHRGRHAGEPDGGVRAHHQHHQRRARVQPHRRSEGGGQDRVLPPVLRDPQGRRWGQLGLRSTAALLVTDTLISLGTANQAT